MTSKSQAGSRAAPSTRWTRTRVRSTWRRKAWPRPAPAEAPSMSPGTSAIVGRRSSSSPRSMTPRFGSRVVNGYGAIFGRAAVRAARSVDLPAFGRPTSPTSAIRRSSSRSQRSSPGSPFWACLGVRWVAVAKWTLPRPPRPPRATVADWPVATRSARSSPVASSSTPVPGGTARTRSSPDLPWRLAPRPLAPGLGPEVVLVAEVEERRQAGIDPQHDAAAPAAVAAVGAAPRDVRLAPKRGGTVPAVAGADPDLDAVEEHRGDCRTGADRGRSAEADRDRAPTDLEVARAG